MSNPYLNLQEHQLWRRAVSGIEKHAVNPVVAPKFAAGPEDQIATIGSCVAQSLGRALTDAGYTHLVAETPDGLTSEQAAQRQYGVFSARTGPVFAAAHLAQLLDEALGGAAPKDTAWERRDRRLVDPYRPQVEPEGYAKEADVRKARATHVKAVRQMMETADMLVVTLAQVEAWRSRMDHRVYPIPPGLVAGVYNPDLHECVSYEFSAVVADLERFLETLRSVNPKVKVILSVSGTPLIATMEGKHVLPASVYGKSVLRAAIETVVEPRDWVDYLPSFEILTGAFTLGTYYEDDFRQVNRTGTAHAARVFLQSFTDYPERLAAARAEVLARREAAGEVENVEDANADDRF